MHDKERQLAKLVGGYGSALVAFSGGVDSTYLLAVAQEVLGDRVLAVTARSPSIPAAEVEEARELAQGLGARLREIETRELDDPEYRRNPPERCYHCKLTLFGGLLEVARAEGLAEVLEGSNADDAFDYRPGSQACAELGVRAPLREVGLTKAEIRALSRARGLATWRKPAMACLASRIPYGEPITAERLARVEQAELALRALAQAALPAHADGGAPQLRVRDHGQVARLEVEPAQIPLLAAEPLRSQVAQALQAVGYRYVALDLQGYRTGAMNEVLALDPSEYAPRPAAAVATLDASPGSTHAPGSGKP